MEISDLVREIERRKVTFDPDNEAYLRYVFELNCQLLERFNKKPGENWKELNIMMKSYIQKDLIFINDYYHKYGRPNILVVPPLSEIPNHIEYSLFRKNKKK